MRWFSETFGLSGWLFADLLLALALLFTAAGGFGASVGSGGQTATPEASSTPTPSPSQSAIALASSCWEVDLPTLAATSPSDEDIAIARGALGTTFRQLDSDALLVLTFAGGVEGEGSRATATAVRVNGVLRQLPHFSASQERDYVNLLGPASVGHVWIEIFTRVDAAPVQGTTASCPK